MKRRSRALKLDLGAQGKEEVEKLLATVALGIVEAVQAGKMSTGDACNLFFVPVFLRFVSPSGAYRGLLARGLLELLHAGSELEDVERLAPHALKSALRDIREKALGVIGALPPSEAQLNGKWLRASAKRGPISPRRRGPSGASGAARAGRPRR
jgi:hypothetical protein